MRNYDLEINIIPVFMKLKSIWLRQTIHKCNVIMTMTIDRDDRDEIKIELELELELEQQIQMQIQIQIQIQDTGYRWIDRTNTHSLGEKKKKHLTLPRRFREDFTEMIFQPSLERGNCKADKPGNFKTNKRHCKVTESS